MAQIPTDIAATNRIPLVGGWGACAKAGGLLSCGPDINDMVRRTATYVDRILKGARAADLPVQQPTKFDLVINITTAKSARPGDPRVVPAARRRG
jgi:putative ABC transport system substrate-binding protein